MAEQNANLDLDVDGDGNEEPEVKSGKPWVKYLLFGLLGLVLLGGIAASTIFLVKMLTDDGGSMAAEESADEMAADDGKPAKKSKEAKQSTEPKAPLTYLPLHPDFVVNFGGDDFGNLMQVGLEVSSRDPAMLELIREHKPAIRNDLVLLFSSQDARVVNTREGKEQLRQDILNTIRATLKKETGLDDIENVYFTSFVMQ